MRRKRAGMTLLELIVAMALLALLLSVTSLGRFGSPPVADTEVSDLRRSAILKRVPQRAILRIRDSLVVVIAHPDGRVVGLPDSNGSPLPAVPDR